MNPSVPVIVVGYDRPKAIERLLNSLLKATYPGHVDLIISIDGGGGEEVKRIAKEFNWPFGEKKLIFHEVNLGLRKHVLSCGDLSRDYDGVIVLEDDLYVSPVFYQFTLQAFDYYKNDPKIAGISLYSHAYNETAQFPFIPLADGSDVFFLQYASSWGQFWSKNWWKAFRTWYDSFEDKEKSSVKRNEHPGYMLPPNISLWPENSWKKYFIKYLIRHDLYFVYPRISLTTIFSDEGTNIRIRETFLQVPLCLDKRDFQFRAFNESCAVYDAFCEIEGDSMKKLAPSLADLDIEVDLYGMKPGDHSEKEMFLSSRRCSQPLQTFGREMKPHEMNIIQGVPGDYFSIGKKKDFEDRNYFLKLLKCHEKKELAYWYTIREYHFYKNRLLAAGNSRPFFHPGFMARKFAVMASYAFKYFRRK